ncbi:hypothetical protein FRZ44_23420 [Hypericibacter terrae]|uniref:Uncharacterized protein n=1 Tax=Hypericibacter terrae TaxID=2602015 RepID=A0A5J6MQB5_9PROT|nr:hypothetical protein FRZ44_23420 [Hypericibacter terrae]
MAAIIDLAVDRTAHPPVMKAVAQAIAVDPAIATISGLALENLDVVLVHGEEPIMKGDVKGG